MNLPGGRKCSDCLTLSVETFLHRYTEAVPTLIMCFQLRLTFILFQREITVSGKIMYTMETCTHGRYPRKDNTQEVKKPDNGEENN